MKIEDTWKSLPEQEERLTGAEIRAGLNLKSEDAVRKLNKRMAWKIAFTILFTPLYIAAMFYVDSWLPQLLFGIITMAHIVGLIFFIKRYQKAKSFDMGSGDSMSTLEAYISNIKETIRQEEVAGLVLYPISAASGFFLSLLQKRSLDEALGDTRILITLVILLIVITPLSHWAARWMNRKTFNKYLNLLEGRLAQMRDNS